MTISKAKARFELVFAGAALVNRFPRYTRWHANYDNARSEASRVLGLMDDYNLPRDAHTAIVYGPGCGRDGMAPSA